MIRTYRALLARALGKLASDRVALIAGLIAILSLALGAASVAVGMSSQANDPSRLAAALRSAGWNAGSRFFDALLSVLAIALGLTFLDRDRTAGTLFGILARPVSRTSVFLTSWAAVALLLSALDFVRSGTLIVGAAWLEGKADPLHLLGVIAGLTGTLLLLTAFFAASAVARPGYAALAGFVGLYLTALAFEKHQLLSGVAHGAVNAVSALLPLGIRQTSIVTGALQGTTGDSGPVLEVILYRVSWIVLLLFVGAFAYSRRDVTPRG
jgi:ABC-type transport system involved in multi-copper enzyme maturation permease subunit